VATHTSEILENGVGLLFEPKLRKWSIWWNSQRMGYRRDLERARAYGLTLPHTAPPPEAVEQEPYVIPPEERVDFFDTRAPVVVVATAFDRSRALSRRQAVAHDRVYGRHRR
jgi:hypothetical protein